MLLHTPITPECVVGMLVMMISMAFFYGEASLFHLPTHPGHPPEGDASLPPRSHSGNGVDKEVRNIEKAKHGGFREKPGASRAVARGAEEVPASSA